MYYFDEHLIVLIFFVIFQSRGVSSSCRVLSRRMRQPLDYLRVESAHICCKMLGLIDSCHFVLLILWGEMHTVLPCDISKVRVMVSLLSGEGLHVHDRHGLTDTFLKENLIDVATVVI
jgi:hypothetical protein